MARSDNAVVGFVMKPLGMPQRESIPGGKLCRSRGVFVNIWSMLPKPDCCLVRPSGWWVSCAVPVMVKDGWSKLSYALCLVQVRQTRHHSIVLPCLRLTTSHKDKVSWSLCKVSSRSLATSPGPQSCWRVGAVDHV